MGKGWREERGGKGYGQNGANCLWSTLCQNRVTDGSSSVVLHLKKVDEEQKLHYHSREKKNTQKLLPTFPSPNRKFPFADLRFRSHISLLLHLPVCGAERRLRQIRAER